MKLWAPNFVQISPSKTFTVDNRSFLLGLDYLYRESMKQYESQTLLPAARRVGQALHLNPAAGPVEGYYSESAELTEYFQWLRALQQAERRGEAVVKPMPEFQLLWDLTNSPLYGHPHQPENRLLPKGRDPLYFALAQHSAPPAAAVLVAEAGEAARQRNDFSLVGLAARIADPVVITALRESTVLYAEVLTFGIDDGLNRIEVIWQVDDELAAAANQFIAAFNRLVPADLALPAATAANARQFADGYYENEFIGRCVRIAQSPDGSRQYHWAIYLERVGDTFEARLDVFWSEKIWTTEMYREAQGQYHQMSAFQEEGVPGWFF